MNDGKTKHSHLLASEGSRGSGHYQSCKTEKLHSTWNQKQLTGSAMFLFDWNRWHIHMSSFNDECRYEWFFFKLVQHCLMLPLFWMVSVMGAEESLAKKEEQVRPKREAPTTETTWRREEAEVVVPLPLLLASKNSLRPSSTFIPCVLCNPRQIWNEYLWLNSLSKHKWWAFGQVSRPQFVLSFFFTILKDAIAPWSYF